MAAATKPGRVEFAPAALSGKRPDPDLRGTGRDWDDCGKYSIQFQKIFSGRFFLLDGNKG